MSGRNIIVLLLCLTAVAVRCWEIDAPFTDPWSWRQSDVAAIARNYSETGFHFARPQIDWAGNQPGFVGTEFPILPFVAAVAYKFLGVHEWIGRAETVALFAFALPFFFALLRELSDEMTGTFALLFYCFAPLSIAAGRTFMPDMPSLSLALAGLYFFRRAVALRRNGVSSDIVIAALLTSLSLLVKLPTAVIAAPMLSLAWSKFGWRLICQSSLWLFGAIAVIPAAVWYWHAHRLAEHFYPYHFFGGGGVRVMNWRWYWHIAVETFSSTLTPVLSILAGAGIVLSRKDRRIALFRWWLVGMILFIIIAGYGNRHQWYQLPLVPIAALFGAAAMRSIATAWNPTAAVAPLLILFLAFSAVSTRKFFGCPAKPLWELGRALENGTPPAALIVAADDGDPTALYYAHRKGWHFLECHGLYYGNPTNSAQIVANLDKLQQDGATHLVFYRGTTWWLDSYREFTENLEQRSVLEYATRDYRIYKLTR